MSMPFDRYLANSHGDDTDGSNGHAAGYYEAQQIHPSSDPHHASYNTPQSTPHSSGVQFQLPPFMYTGPPTLAPGGGAEVLQAGMFSGPGGNWLANSGFSHAAGSQSVVADANAAYGTALDSFLRHSENVGYGPDPSGAWGASSASSVDAPSAFGLPVYSASGFDLLGILGRVVNRPSPKIHLGPVDMTCSFVVTDTRRYDHPIVYASHTFCTLTGYSESEILGRNCRFLQSPDGRLVKGEERRFTSPEAVNLMRKSLMADKECQTSLVNYKKGGQAFINLVTVIPVGGGINDTPEERDTVCYHVGFQVDLTQQPNAILERLKDGSYMVNYSKEAAIAPTIRRPLTQPNAQTFVPMSTELRHLLSDGNFTSSLPLSTTANVILNSPKPESYDDHELLNLLLLETLPDFIHVLSLKGVFLYVAPSVRRVLGYEPEELVGKSISDFCHDADLVPLMRELKESSATPSVPGTDDPAGGTVLTGPQSVQAVLVGPGPGGPPKTVDLLFRIRAKHGGYVWLDCRGRLHVEPGKGRKAIIMSGRRRGMPRLAWRSVATAGGVAPSSVTPPSHMDPVDLPSSSINGADALPGAPTVEKTSALEHEFWAKVSREGTVLFVGAGARDVLGWGAGELIGRPLADFIDSSAANNGVDTRQAFLRALTNVVARSMSASSSSLAQQLEVRETENVSLEMSRKNGERVSVDVILYRSHGDPLGASSPRSGTPISPDEQWSDGAPSSLARGGAPPAPVVVQVRLASMTGVGRLTRDGSAGVFEELETRRGTSWQYELQQLKYANRRLADEVAALEASGVGSPTGGALSQPGDVTGRDESGVEGWRTRAGMKRSWDGVDGEGISG